jgi:hypothetical protein
MGAQAHTLIAAVGKEYASTKQSSRMFFRYPIHHFDRTYMGAVWLSFFLTSFSENLVVGRIWLWGESEYYYDYVWRKIKLFIRL